MRSEALVEGAGATGFWPDLRRLLWPRFLSRFRLLVTRAGPPAPGAGDQRAWALRSFCAAASNAVVIVCCGAFFGAQPPCLDVLHRREGQYLLVRQGRWQTTFLLLFGLSASAGERMSPTPACARDCSRCSSEFRCTHCGCGLRRCPTRNLPRRGRFHLPLQRLAHARQGQCQGSSPR